ncbi:redoxin domain-containing protein [Rubritalea spongiae]|uniref:Redoxin domain-containing protein n=1 Tax=Rubritalea spongiae TaxID=430797 RepID=A0ABW5E1J2_9BACT
MRIPLITSASIALVASAFAETKQPNQELVGKQAPTFTLKNQDNQDVSLDQYKGKKNVVLVFSRAPW